MPIRIQKPTPAPMPMPSLVLLLSDSCDGDRDVVVVCWVAIDETDDVAASRRTLLAEGRDGTLDVNGPGAEGAGSMTERTGSDRLGSAAEDVVLEELLMNMDDATKAVVGVALAEEMVDETTAESVILK